MSRRLERVNFTLQKELGHLIETQVSDPRLAPLTSVTRVDTSPDLAMARVYISVLGGEEESASSLAALQSAASFLRREMKSRVRMRFIPRIEFRLDDRIKEGTRMLEVINEVTRQDNAESTEQDPTRDA
ncbi:MAG: 30S ribosome-binding factor RbfA [Chloroflexota bacterium]